MIPLLAMRLAQPAMIVDLGRLPELRGIRREGSELAIGAMTTYREIQLSAEVHQRAPVLAEAAHGRGQLDGVGTKQRRRIPRSVRLTALQFSDQRRCDVR